MNPGVGYTMEQAFECVREPQLSLEVFEQTQLTFEMVFSQLYGFHVEAKDPSATDYPH